MSEEFTVDNSRNVLQFCLVVATLIGFVGGVFYGTFLIPEKVKEAFGLERQAEQHGISQPRD